MIILEIIIGGLIGLACEAGVLLIITRDWSEGFWRHL